ncbi:MAG: S46 family peptidase, partial [Saprospiraceae bacterium]|nr:S46 family peptidase [Saprospiraceae bacterium]
YRVYNYSILLDSSNLFALFKAPAKDIEIILNQDVGFKLGKGFLDNYKDNVSPKYNELNDQIDQLKRNYMQAQMEVFPEKKFWPDANSTLRVAYGKVQGYEPKDAVQYHYLTTTRGITEKYKPGDYEYDVPERLLELIEKKDYGMYADENGQMPVCFIGSNHTTGGNSGSPTLDAEGNLIGLNFDRAWEGTMSDINYDINLCRNIMVDMRYVLFIIDKYAGAGYLVKEMDLVK